MGRADSLLRNRLIFNVGSRRSGTYWLQRIVTAHPQVASVPSETHLLSHGVAPLMERFQHDEPGSLEVGKAYIERDRLLDLLRELCDATFSASMSATDHRVAERTPLHVFHLPLIAEIYPDARFVHIIRDGRDVARSITAQPWGPSSVGEAAAEWRDAVQAGRSAKLGDERYAEVRYEALSANPEDEIRALYEWLGLPAEFSDVARGLAESRREENVDQFGTSGVATEKWREALSNEDLESFNEVAGDLLAELGYGRVEPARKRSMGRGRRMRSRRR